MSGLAVLRIIRIKLQPHMAGHIKLPRRRKSVRTHEHKNDDHHNSCHKCASPIRSGKEPRHSKDTPILHRRFSRRITSTRHRKILPEHHRHIRPVVPRRNTNLLRKLINPINRSAFVTSHNDERLIHSVQGSRHHGHQVFLILALQQRSIYLFAFTNSLI